MSIIFPWTLTKRSKEKDLISKVKQTDFFKNVEANLHDDEMKGIHNVLFTVEHIIDTGGGLEFWMIRCESGSALPSEFWHVIVHSDKGETVLNINFRIDNEYDRVRRICHPHGTNSPS